MTHQAEAMALAQIHTLCEGHAQALTDALDDQFARLEQLAWLPDAQAWNVLRHIRNEFTHDYPETSELRFEKFTAAQDASTKLLARMHRFTTRLEERQLILSHRANPLTSTTSTPRT